MTAVSEIFILGSGGFGTALSIALSEMGHAVRLWGWQPEFQQKLRRERENTELLKGVAIPESVDIVDDMARISDAELVLVATPSVGVRQTVSAVRGLVRPGVPIASVSKGFEPGSLKRLSQVIAEENPVSPVLALSGPSHAEEVARGVPTALVAASSCSEAVSFVQDVMGKNHLRLYASDDIVGVETGGALKNIIALAAGIADGLKLGDNTKAAMMTRGITEIARLGTAMGARPLTFAGLSGIGDLIVTCTSMHSRNRRAGILIGKGESAEQAVRDVGMTVEGITATQCAFELSQKLNVEMPITAEVYRVITGGTSPRQGIANLMGRPQRHELEDAYLTL
jgi:glycerol-3-phosphate dehydrogenase (NAD(P)+)